MNGETNNVLPSPGLSNSRTSIRTMVFIVSTIVMLFLYYQWQQDNVVFSDSKFHEIEVDSDGPSYLTINELYIKKSVQNMKHVDCEYLTDVLESVQATLDRLDQTWNTSYYPNFKTMMHIPNDSWNLQKAKMIKLVLEASSNQSNSTNAAQDELKFVVGFSGSSVTAGHDNYFSEAFPQIFSDTLAPTFSTMRVPLEVRNQALGNNPCYPYDACIATHLGEDLDVLVWEQVTTSCYLTGSSSLCYHISMNCGRWSTPLDTFSRAAYAMPKKPTLLYLASGGPSWTRQECLLQRNTTTSLPRAQLTDTEVRINQNSLRQNAAQSGFLSEFTFLKDADGALLSERFASLAPMAQSVFSCDEYKCLGPYNSSFNEKTPGGGATHHPGRQMHRLRGENLAYFYLAILAEAVTDIRRLNCPGPLGNLSQHPTGSSNMSMSSGSSSGSGGMDEGMAKRFAAVAHALSLPASPSPNYTPLLALANPNSSTTQDTYLFALTYLLSIQSTPLPAVPGAYRLPEIASAPQCYTNFEPRQQNALAEVVVARHSNWVSELSFLDRAAVERSAAKGYGYIDRKYIYRSAGVNSTIAVLAAVATASPVWLCEVQKGFAKYPSTMADLNEGAAVYAQLHYTGPGTEKKFLYSASSPNATALLKSYEMPDLTQLKLLDLSPLYIQCYRTSPLPAGTHMLVVQQRGDKQVNLAYMISW